VRTLLSNIRRLTRRVVRNTGFQRRIAPDFVDVMHANNIDVVIDVGANDGDYGREIRDRGYRGRIVSFEPNPVAFERLEQKITGDQNWSAYQCGVGDKDGELEFSIAVNDAMSSFKGLTEFGKSTGAKQAATACVKVIRLDTFLSEHPDLLGCVYLKIDTQGFEVEVLRGAGEMLEQITAVQAEIALVHTYTDEEDWLSIITWMRDRGLEVATAICNSRVEAQVREFDFVFVRRR
jgi:FkbM family methyltransferase